MTPLMIYPVKTRIFRPKEDIESFIIESVSCDLVKEKMVLVITSKIVSLSEERLISQSASDKASLVRAESDHFYGEIGYGCFLTIKHGLLIPSAGIDESNSESGDYILYPIDPFKSAEKLWNNLRKAWKLKELGLILTDSHTSPLRRGVTGICLSHFGFRAVKNLIGNKDLFGRELRMTQMNLADGLSAGAVMLMGEGSEATPLAVIHNADIEFSETTCLEELQIPIQEDLYRPLLEAIKRS